MENYLKFNLNDKIKVKIKEKGYQYIVENYFCKPYDLNHVINQFKEMADHEGYTEMQAWQLISQFGRLGMNLWKYIDINILIEQKP